MKTVDQELHDLGITNALNMPDDDFAEFVRKRNKQREREAADAKYDAQWPPEKIWFNPNDLLSMHPGDKRVFLSDDAFAAVKREAEILGRKFVYRGAGRVGSGYVRAFRVG